MNTKVKKFLFHTLDFIFLILSYMLCDYITSKINIALGIIIGLATYMVITLILHKIFKIEI